MPKQTKAKSPKPKKSRRELLAATMGLVAGGASVAGANAPQQAAEDKWLPKKQAAGLRASQTSKGALISNCIRSGHLLFTSGVSGWYPDRRKEPGDAKVQIQSALTSIKETLERAGSSMDNVLKVYISLVDPEANFDLMNEGYKGFFSDPPPVRSFAGVTGFRRKGPLLQVDCIAYVD
jgi:enamine deaminase RidA (YjgF/YER057c/UK114 family)